MIGAGAGAAALGGAAAAAAGDPEAGCAVFAEKPCAHKAVMAGRQGIPYPRFSGDER